MRKIPLVIVLVLSAACAVNTIAQSAPTTTKPDEKTSKPQTMHSPTLAGSSTDDGDVIKINTQLVSVPVRVIDKKGRFIGGLAKENFRVFEDGSEQEVALFSNEHQPFTVALVIDMSYSTTFKIVEIQNSAIKFIDQLRPQDKVMVISFDEDVHMLCEATSDRQAIYRAIKNTKIATGTSLYEAVDLVMNDRLRRIDGRKAIILFTDGVDTTSHRSNDLQNLNDAMELDSLIYTIRYDTFEDVQEMKNRSIITKPVVIVKPVPTSGETQLPIPIPTGGTPNNKGTTTGEYQRAAEYLTNLAERTGGRIYEASNLGNLADAYSKIASELREFYSIGYYPKEERVAGKRTSVKVKVNIYGLVVRSRQSFIRRLPK